MPQFAGSRFGQDTAPRIAATTELLMEAGELPPVPMYQPLVPFYPGLVNGDSSGGAGSSVISSGASLVDTGPAQWKSYPDRLDIYVYQGDDVQVPLYFQDPTTPDFDISTGWTWESQIRFFHTYYSMQLVKLSVESEYIPPEDPDDDTSLGSTLVTLFLPRFWNRYCGVYAWDLFSTSPYVGPDFEQPDGVKDEDWLQDQVKTWLYGRVYVVPRVSQTDWLPPHGALPTQTQVIVTPTGVYGPNGRVP